MNLQVIEPVDYSDYQRLLSFDMSFQRSVSVSWVRTVHQEMLLKASDLSTHGCLPVTGLGICASPRKTAFEMLCHSLAMGTVVPLDVRGLRTDGLLQAIRWVVSLYPLQSETDSLFELTALVVAELQESDLASGKVLDMDFPRPGCGHRC